MDGHQGWYLELSVPATSDLSRCDAQDLDYFTAGGGSRHTNTAGGVDRLYVVDVSGEVVIIDAGYTPQAPADRGVPAHGRERTIRESAVAPCGPGASVGWWGR